VYTDNVEILGSEDFYNTFISYDASLKDFLEKVKRYEHGIRSWVIIDWCGESYILGFIKGGANFKVNLPENKRKKNCP
jgi:hypothetical protein